ncbi:tyrosine-type recombinase/integrase [Candidatus Synchoanobacter obligatus]|uniref:Tyrosine-type recombinase/integrase n=1 Tax=Candidatus Synchoanobacter obligatus TaxID=2919597 RepID=A0ABT1L767_9GAMM|nr:tyrosine-type recombinase/integrase [Candidatus Synchoanobacter obligatus]
MNGRFIPRAIFYDSADLLRRIQAPIDVPQEYAAVRLFLLSYVHSQDTYNTYRREIERYCQWVWFVNKTLLSEVIRHDLQGYIRFFQDPPSNWVSTKHVARYVESLDGLAPNPLWRPFVITVGKKRMVSSAGMKSMLACLSTFYNFLLHEQVVNQNPVQMLRQKNQLIQTVSSSRVKRRLTNKQWSYVISVAQKKAIANPLYERTLYLLTLFYLLGLRISEVSESKEGAKAMNLFFQDQQGRWWFEAHGKGNKVRQVAVPDAMLEGLKRYRQSLGLGFFPVANDLSPLVPKLKGQGGLSARQIRALISESFSDAVMVILHEGFSDESEGLKQATVHWLRHTSISEDVLTRPNEHVRDDVGHENIATTSLYMDVHDEERHRSAKDKPLKRERC